MDCTATKNSFAQRPTLEQLLCLVNSLLEADVFSCSGIIRTLAELKEAATPIFPALRVCTEIT